MPLLLVSSTWGSARPALTNRPFHGKMERAQRPRGRVPQAVRRQANGDLARSQGSKKGEVSMTAEFRLVEPGVRPPLDPGFRPAVLANRAFQEEVEQSRSGTPLVLGLQRPGGPVSRYETRVFGSDHPRAGANLFYADRLLKMKDGRISEETHNHREKVGLEETHA